MAPFSDGGVRLACYGARKLPLQRLSLNP